MSVGSKPVVEPYQPRWAISAYKCQLLSIAFHLHFRRERLWPAPSVVLLCPHARARVHAAARDTSLDFFRQFGTVEAAFGVRRVESVVNQRSVALHVVTHVHTQSVGKVRSRMFARILFYTKEVLGDLSVDSPITVRSFTDTLSCQRRNLSGAFSLISSCRTISLALLIFEITGTFKYRQDI